MNQNQPMVEFILSIDAETEILKNEINLWNQKPWDIEVPAAFHQILYHIWEASSSPDNIDRLKAILKNEGEGGHVNMQTYIGKNTPLHFVVMYENADAVKQLLKHEDIKIDLENSHGHTPL